MDFDFEVHEYLRTFELPCQPCLIKSSAHVVEIVDSVPQTRRIRCGRKSVRSNAIYFKWGAAYAVGEFKIINQVIEIHHNSENAEESVEYARSLGKSKFW